MKGEDLTPGELAAIKELARKSASILDEVDRARERRSRRGVARASVRKNEWTIQEARHSGLKRSVRSALQSHENSLVRFDQIQKEVKRTARELEEVSKKLEEFESNMTLEEEKEA